MFKKYKLWLYFVLNRNPRTGMPLSDFVILTSNVFIKIENC